MQLLNQSGTRPALDPAIASMAATKAQSKHFKDGLPTVIKFFSHDAYQYLVAQKCH